MKVFQVDLSDSEAFERVNRESLVHNVCPVSGQPPPAPLEEISIVILLPNGRRSRVKARAINFLGPELFVAELLGPLVVEGTLVAGAKAVSPPPVASAPADSVDPAALPESPSGGLASVPAQKREPGATPKSPSAKPAERPQTPKPVHEQPNTGQVLQKLRVGPAPARIPSDQPVPKPLVPPAEPLPLNNLARDAMDKALKALDVLSKKSPTEGKSDDTTSVSPGSAPAAPSVTAAAPQPKPGVGAAGWPSSPSGPPPAGLAGAETSQVPPLGFTAESLFGPLNLGPGASAGQGSTASMASSFGPGSEGSGSFAAPASSGSGSFAAVPPTSGSGSFAAVSPTSGSGSFAAVSPTSGSGSFAAVSPHSGSGSFVVPPPDGSGSFALLLARGSASFVEPGSEPAGPALLPNEAVSLTLRLRTMDPAQQEQLALNGNREARRLLIDKGDGRVQAAVFANPEVTPEEVREYVRRQDLAPAAFRFVASHKVWKADRSVVATLLKNASLPRDLIVPLLLTLKPDDLRVIANSTKLFPAVRAAATELLRDSR